MKKKLLLLLLLLAPALVAPAQTLPQDEAVRKGTLKNGLTYYIRHNDKEPGLCDFYIAQRVGSILEEPRQRGLAHFLEHMAFNGTKHFPGKGKQLGIVPWCESIGVKFGANLNAYTSVDQTVYHIGSAPLKREGIIDSCLLVLHDWSHYILLEEKEIDKERGVIHEEWRTRRAGMAVQRMMEEVLPRIYRGTKYEDCLPIGSMDIVDNFPYQDLRDYYQKWYRPDLQAVVVVGDIDVDKMERKIRKLFSKIPLPKQRAERIYYPVNDNDSMIVAIETDAEQPIALAHLYMKRDATPDAEKQTYEYLRSGYVEGLITSMLNSRLAELRQQAQPPFSSATTRDGLFFVSRTKDAFSMSISCNRDNILGGIITAVAAVERARQHGFTQQELERAKKVVLAAAERRQKNAPDRRNSSLVSQCVNNFLTGSAILSPDFVLENTKKLDTEVTLQEVNKAVGGIITNKNQVFVLYGPKKEGFEIPSEQVLRQVVLAAQQQTYSPYKEEQLANKLMADSELPKPGTIVSEKPFGKHGVTELTLSNGMRVYVKPTTFEKDNVSMVMKADGGTSNFGDEDIPNFSLITSGTLEGGVGKYDATTLRKMLTGKVVRVQPSVGSRAQRISAASSLKDMQTMFQLSHLYFTQPRRDSAAFEGLMNRTRSFLSNRNASPKVDYNDSINAILYGHHPRTAPVVRETLDHVSYDRILQLYKQSFSDASAFRTVIIGNVALDELRPLICQYLASLPATGKGSAVNEQHVPQLVKEDRTHVFRKKMSTPLANVSIFFGAQVPFTPKNDLVLDYLKRCLSIAYTDSVREEKGGTYGVSVDFGLDRDDNPDAMLRISYNADPNRYEELNPIIYQQLKWIAEHGPVASSMEKVRQYLVKQYDQVAITNDYWSYIIWHQLDDEADFDEGYCDLVNSITPQDVQQMAQQLLKSGYRTEVTMLSE
ncbi:MAG: insulinase family protein [Prevotella sp.]|nr:insulinase family protein [Prevotella sp.]